MIMLFWSAGQADFLGWYVNLQQPLRRTALGFDYLDQELDIVISPDRSTWSWKDEAAFEDAQRRGVISPRQAALVRAAGEHIIAHLHDEQSIFAQSWEHWSPPTTWRIPKLPLHWESVE